MKKEIKGTYYIKNVNERFGDNFFLNVNDTVYYNLVDYGYWSADFKNASREIRTKFKYASRKIRAKFIYISSISKLLNELGFELDKNIELTIRIDEYNSECEYRFYIDFSDELSIYYDWCRINDIEKFSIVINKSLIKNMKNFEKVYLNCVYSNDNNNINIEVCDDYILLNIKCLEELDL